MAKEVIEIVVKTGKAQTNVKKVDKSLKGAGKSAMGFGATIKTAFVGMKASVMSMIPALNLFKGALISTGVGALIVAAGALVGVLMKAAKVGAEFGKGVSTLRAITSKTADELSVLTEQAKELGATTAFTAKQVLDLQTELAKLGFSIQDIENSTPAILDLAASLEVDLGSAAAFAGATVKSFGLETEETQRVVDVMALATSKSALDFDKLRESLKMVAPVSSAANVSVEKTTALLGALADRGISGSMAGTGLSKTFIELSKKGMTLEEAMNKVNTSSNKLNTAIELVGAVGGKSLLNLASTGTEKLQELEQEFMNAEGSAKSMAEVRLDNLEGDMTKLGSAWEGFLLGIEDGEGPINKMQRTFIKGLTWAITGLGKVVDVIAFAWNEQFTGMKLILGGFKDVSVGLFKIIGGAIYKFSQDVLISLSKVPILGSGINVGAAKRRMREATKIINDGAKDIQDGVEQFKTAAVNRITAIARFNAQQEGKAARTEKAKQDKIDVALAEEKAVKDKEAAEERAKQKAKDLEKIASIERKFLKLSEDMTDTSSLLKAQRKRERALKEIEALKLSETEKREAIKAVNDYYDSLEVEAKKKDEETRLAEIEKEKQEDLKKAEAKVEKLELDREYEQLGFEEKRALINERRALLLEDEMLSEEQKVDLLDKYAAAEKQIDDTKLAGKVAALDGVIALAGAESGVGKALLVAKSALAMKETIMDLKRITFKGKQAAAETVVDTTSNVASSAKIGFPWNIVTIAAAIGQGISIISQMKKAVRSTGASPASMPSPSISGGAGSGGGAQAPSFNMIGSSGTNQLAEAIGGQSQQPIQAFVVSNDVTTAQSMERNTIDGASIG
jgi:hypothetical protein